jgi:hypothetical protein
MFHAKHLEGQGRIRHRQGNTLVTWLKTMKNEKAFWFLQVTCLLQDLFILPHTAMGVCLEAWQR